MNIRNIKLNLHTFLLSSAFVFCGFLAEAQGADVIYKITATNARLNRLVTGTPTSFVDGIPAAPVDSFTWDGNGSVPLDRARIRIVVDPVSNTGFIRARWEDENGEWRYRHHHAVG